MGFKLFFEIKKKSKNMNLICWLTLLKGGLVGFGVLEVKEKIDVVGLM